MREKFPPNSVIKNLRLASLLSVTALAIVFGIWSLNPLQNEDSADISANSLKSLAALNYKHEMIIVEDLMDDSDSRMISSLYSANVLLKPEDEQETYKGLLITVEDDKIGDSVLLLEPLREYSDAELETIADFYEKEIPEFTDVELDQEIELGGNPVYSLFPGIYRRSRSRSYEYLAHGTPVRVAVIDSGVDPNHPIFDDEHLMSGWNTVDNNAKMYDDIGHGTHIAGIIRINAPSAIIIPYKIVGADGGRLSNVIKAFDKAIDTKVDIINTSFGVLSPSTALQKITERATDKGIFVVSAAGNLNTSKGFYPATFPTTIAVASVDNYGRKMAKSNYGNWIDIASYGTAIWSSLPGNDYGHKSGTSQATAYITAAIVRLLDTNEIIDANTVLDRLNDNGRPITSGPLAGLTIVR